MKASIEIATTHIGEQSRPSLSLIYDGNRYIFNVPEGTQRFCYSNGIRFSQLKAVFVNRMNLDSYGGLPGLILTVCDANALSEVRLVGPIGITHYIAASRSFILRRTVRMAISEYVDSNKDIYSDEYLTVRAARLISDDISPSFISEREKRFQNLLSKKRKITQSMFAPPEEQKECIQPSPVVEDSIDDHGLQGTGSSLCYICQGQPIKGKFNVKRAIELNVMGKDRGRLMNGETITVNGIVITPQDVVAPEKPGPIILIIDCPSPSYINSLIENAEIKNALESKENPPKIAVHQLGKGVLEDSRYNQWVASNFTGFKNFFFAPGLHQKEVSFGASTDFLNELSKIDDEIFPSIPKSQKSSTFPDVLSKDNNGDFQVAKQLTEFQFLPKEKFIVQPRKEISISKSNDYSSIQPVIDTISKSVPPTTEYSDEFVIPLGTGSAIPSRYKNVSGTWFYHQSGSILFDAGEGTLGQLDRRFGDQLDVQLQSMKAIFVSHLHGDHQLGVFTVIRHWLQITDENAKLFIIAPRPSYTWICDLAALENVNLNRVQFLDCKILASDPFGDYSQELRSSTNFQSFTPVPVDHCKLAFAAVVKYKNGFSVSFSGDCRPSSLFAQIGRDSDLLIHEATLPDDMKADAIKKKHSTFSEAIEVGKRMNAKNILLTHFSQRLPKYLAIYSPKTLEGNIGVALDLMKVPMKSFYKLPILNSRAIESFFTDDQKEDDILEPQDDQVIDFPE